MIFDKDHKLIDGVKYRVNRKIPVVKIPDPNFNPNPEDAEKSIKEFAKKLTEIRHLREGKTFKVIDSAIIRNKVFYRTNKGFINEIALFGANVERLDI